MSKSRGTRWVGRLGRTLSLMVVFVVLAAIFASGAFAVNFGSSAYRGGNIFYNAGYAPARFYPNGVSPKLGRAKGNCTWYAHGRVREMGYTGTGLNAMYSNAGAWANQAAGKFAVDKNPTVGAIAQIPGSLGHVAVVEAVYSNGTIMVSESSWSATPGTAWDYEYRTRVVSRSAFTNYIHVLPAGAAPAPAPAPNPAPTSRRWVSSAVVIGNAPGSWSRGTSGFRAIGFNIRAPWSVNVRSGPGTQYPVVAVLPANSWAACDGWQHGTAINDAWGYGPDARWYRLR